MIKIDKKMISKILMMFIVILLILSNIYIVQATVNPNDFEPSSLPNNDVSKLTNMANPIIGVMRVAGIALAFIMLMVLGIKYMAGSVSEKAEYKKTMIPYLIGAILIVAVTQILAVIIEIATNLKA